MCTILIVEDVDDHRELERLLLTNAGHTVHEAKNGQEALDWLYANPVPCAILLDLMMPVMDGWDFLNALRRYVRWRDLPVIVLSVRVQEQQALPVMTADAYWPKPLAPERLEHIHEWCSKHGRTAPVLKQSSTRLIEKHHAQMNERAGRSASGSEKKKN
jgi:CheY-like chemotaxis protein